MQSGALRGLSTPRGGDIDLYVELTEPLADAAWCALRFSGALQQAFGAQRIDVITRGP